MNETRSNAAIANCLSYTPLSRDQYISGAPHIRHKSLRRLYDRLATTVFDNAQNRSRSPRVLDLGAGEGSVTAMYLSRGAQVTAVDITENRLTQLKERCKGLKGKLEIICSEAQAALDTLAAQSNRYEIVVATAFLHHIPCYEDLLRKAVRLLVTQGQLLTFEDPLRYSSLGWPTRLFNGAAYFSWRLFQEDLRAGARRYLRRRAGNYTNIEEDDVEYHVVRDGVDQEAIRLLLTALGMDCHIIRYYSTQAPLWEAVGRHLGITNSFGIVATLK